MKTVLGFLNTLKIRYYLLIVFLLGLVANNNLQKKDGFGTPFVADVDQYYSILPAAFTYQDIAYGFDNPQTWNKYYPEGTYTQRYWTTPYIEGRRITMVSLGMSYAYLGFYIPVFLVEKVFPNDDYAPGYSPMYILGAKLFVILLACINFLFVFKIAVRYVNKLKALLTASLLLFGTGMYYYFFGEGLMPHATLTVLISIFIFACLKLLLDGKLSYLPLLAFLIAWIGLIRPTDVLIGFFPLCLLLKKEARINLLASLKSLKQLALSVGLIALIVVPQLLYWKYITGSYLFYSYKEETFHFTTSNLFDFWFSFRKGWFVYAPLCLLILAAPFLWIKKISFETIGVFSVIVATSMLYAQWWCWWYGGSFGMRTMTQFIPFLVFPLTMFFNYSTVKLKALFFVLAGFLVYQNIMLSRRYHLGYIHYDSTTYASFLPAYKGNTLPFDFYGLLEKPDYKGARRNGKEFEFKEVFNVERVVSQDFYVGTLTHKINPAQGYVVSKVYHKQAYDNVTLVLKVVNKYGQEIFHQQKYLNRSNFSSTGEGFNILDFTFEKTDLEDCTVFTFVYNPAGQKIELSKLELTLY